LVRWLRRQHLLSLIRLPLGQRRSMARVTICCALIAQQFFIIGSCYSCRRTSMKSIVKRDNSWFIRMKRRHFKAFSLASAQSCIK
jgi:hypothetical protein